MYAVDDALRRKYDVQYSGGTSEWRDLSGLPKARHIMDLCQRINLRPQTTLDVGCGEGSILKHLDEARFCPKLYAVDISASGVAALEKRALPSLIEAKVFDGYSLPYSDKQFDLAICSHVLEHVEYERVLLRELARVARIVFIEIPVDFRPFADRQAAHFMSYGHINMYSPTTLRFLLLTEGFTILQDALGVTLPELSCYNYFYNQKREAATEENVQRKMDEWTGQVELFYKKDRAAQEATATDYCVILGTDSMGIRAFQSAGSVRGV